MLEKILKHTGIFFKQLIEFGCPKSMSQNRAVCQCQYGPEPAPLVVPLTWSNLISYKLMIKYDGIIGQNRSMRSILIL